MKTPINNSAKCFWLIYPILLAALVWTAGCATQTPDPLAGWTFRPFPGFEMPPYGHNTNHLNKAITENYQDFIAKNKLDTLGAITGFFENGTGQYAVGFRAFDNNHNAYWHYALFYEKENRRTKVIKYGYHRFMS
jgi:hypothetical protein